MAADAALPGPQARARARHPRADLLQVRGRLPDGEPQAEHRGRTGVLQRAGRRRAARDGDRRRPVGLVPRVRGSALRARGRRVHGACLVRAEAVPPRADGGVRRAVRAEPLRGDGGRPGDPRRAPRLDRQPGHRDLGGGRAGRAARGHEVLARLRPEPRAPAPDRDRRGGHRPAGPRRGVPRRADRLHGRGLELLRARLPVHRPAPDAAREDAHPRLDLRPARIPRGRPPLPRHGAARQPPARPRADRSARVPPDRGVRGRRPLRARGGDPARARGEPRREGRARRGAAVQGGGERRDEDRDYDEGELAMALAGLPTVAV